MAHTPNSNTQAAPAGWAPVDNGTGYFVVYARRLKGNGHPVTGYNTNKATTPAQRKLVAAWAKAKLPGPYVVVNHTTGVAASFATWPLAYAYTTTMRSPSMAASVAASVGTAGMATLRGMVPAIAVRQAVAVTPAVVAPSTAKAATGKAKRAAKAS